MRKNKLLSIGEISKLTGASIKSLRYYEQINILKPAYIDPDSGYRYYSYTQSYFVGLIQFAVELDIPLKELSEFIDGQDTMNFGAFATHGKQVARKKIKALRKGLKLIEFYEQKMALQEEHPLEQIYTREVPQKHFYLIPYEQTFEDIDLYEMNKLLLGTPYYEETSDDYGELLEYGLLCEHSPSGISRYVFLEVPKGKARADCKIISAGQYYCRQSDTSQIEQAAEIFGDYLVRKESFTVIETEIFLSGKFDVNKPINELRVTLP